MFGGEKLLSTTSFWSFYIYNFKFSQANILKLNTIKKTFFSFSSIISLTKQCIPPAKLVPPQPDASSD